MADHAKFQDGGQHFLKLYDQAKQVFEGTMRRVYEERLFHRLTDLYIAYSGYCYSMGLYQEALVTLSMAEANLVYAANQGICYPPS